MMDMIPKSLIDNTMGGCPHNVHVNDFISHNIHV